MNANYTIEAKNGETNQSDEQYRLIGPDGEVIIDWGTAFSAYAEKYEELTGEAIDSPHEYVGGSK